jgi:hypothetical protein
LRQNEKLLIYLPIFGNVRKKIYWFHCSDKKRKKIFIKEDAWTEYVNNVKTKKAIKDVSFIQAKNVKNIQRKILIGKIRMIKKKNILVL